MNKIIVLLPVLLFILSGIRPLAASGLDDLKGISAYFTPAPSPVTDINQITFVDRPPESAYEAVVQTLSSAKKSIYLAAYEFNIYHLSQVLIDRLKKGVKVFLLVEADNLKLMETYFLLDRLYQAGAQITPDQKKGGIMHNKYAVVDERFLVTGSANYSVNAFFQQYNDIVIIDHPELALEYLKRFTELTEKRYRRQSSLSSFEPEMFFDRYNQDIHYQAVFSRSVFDPTRIMVNTISTCKKNLRFLIFAFSSIPITEAMKRCLKKGKVMGIFDNAFESENITRNWKSIPFQILWETGAEVKYDNVKEKIHHKNLVIDRETVITGSFNFSANAQKNNDENYLIIRSPELARRYLDRFNALWKTFPSETLFEKYIRARNQKKTSLSFNDYEKKHFSQRISSVRKELKKRKFRGQVAIVEDGNTVIVTLAKSGERIRVTLAGIIAPIGGNRHYHQEPQSHLAKEGLLFLAGQREVTGTVVEGKGFDVHALLYDEKGNSINAAMIRDGLVYPTWSRPDFLSAPPLTYEENPNWKAELPKLQNALKQAQKEKRMLWGGLALSMSPLEFKRRLDKMEIQKKLKENQYSLGKFERGVWIGNRKTGKAYPPGSPTYMEYLRDLNDNKLIFFHTREDAQAAGYLLKNEKNY